MTIQRLLIRLVSFTLLCVLFTQTAFSQTKTITGKVLDDKGAPLQGATVSVKGTKQGASSGPDGSFSITVPSTANTLVISSIGFTNQEVSIASSTTVSVTLVPSQNALNEVVVVGYNTVRRKDLTGAVTTVSAKEFNTGVITSPDQLLQNKVAGLEIINNSGQPGSATTVKIRGNTSIRGLSNPIYVIDGVILDGRNARPSVNLGIGGFGTTPDANPLLFINPYDIQDVTILKDASATAIYGSRGANGVIVITTKKASAGATKFEGGLSEGWNVGYMKKYDILNAGEFRSALNKFGVANQDKGSTVDPLKDISQHSTIQNYYMAVSGGNENGKFRASALASKTPGLIKTNNLNKYIGTLGGQYKFLDKRVTLDFNMIYGRTEENIVNISNTAGSQGNLISAALQWNPTAPYYQANGMYNVLGNGVGNPLSLLAAYNDVANVTTLLANMSATVNIVKGLDYKFLYSVNQSDGTRATNIDGFLRGFNPIDGNGLGINSTANLTSQIITHTLNYHTNLTEDLTLNALAGFEYWKSNFGNSSYSGQTFNFNLNELQLVPGQYTDNLGNAKTVGTPSVFRDITTETQSLFARVELNYKDRYHFTGTFRDDGSSKFGSANKHGYFPSFGAKWTISGEDFMKDSKTFSNLAIRGTWGITGSQDFPAGAAIDQYSIGTYNSGGQSNVGNTNLKWEKTTQFDFGLDFGFLNNRIYGSVDYYNKNTTQILFQSIVIQPGPGLGYYWINLPGHLKNQGAELTLGAAIVQTRDFDWNLNFNMAYNKNKITDFPAGLAIYTGQVNGQGVSGTLSQVITNNQPVDEFWLKKFTGFDQKGNQTYANNPSFAGDPNPKWLYGGSTSLRYKKATLTLSGGGNGGYLILNNTAISVTNLSGLPNGRNVDRNAVHSGEGTGSPVAANTRFLESGNFFKLRSANLTYSLGNLGQYIKNANVFVSGSNLFVITKFSGFDPEVNIDKNNNGYPSQSIEYIPYPTPRSFIVGLNFSL